MDINRLQTFLLNAEISNLCTRINCTTCGAMEFRIGVVHSVTGKSIDPRRLARETLLDIARALADVQQVQAYSIDESAIRCILFDLWSGIPHLDREIEEILQSSWAGSVLQGMKDHYAAIQTLRQQLAEFQSPDAIRMRIEKKKLLKQEQHALRLEVKKERDKIWRSKQV